MRLRAPDGGAYPSACASIVFAALRSLAIDDSNQLHMAVGLVNGLRSHAEALVQSARASAHERGAEWKVKIDGAEGQRV